jgi:Tfp pilus assembly protein FimT
MSSKAIERERGFTVFEGAVAVAIFGVALAFAAPKITGAMRDYRLNIAMRQVVDTLKRAKMQAISESKRSGVAIDVGGRRIGLVTYQGDGVTVERIDYIPLPSGVVFQRPSNETAAPEGVTASGVTSFPTRNGVYIQDFNTRGFPAVTSGADVLSIFLGNDQNHRAITMTSVGGVRTYRFEDRAWQNTRAANTSGS